VRSRRGDEKLHARRRLAGICKVGGPRCSADTRTSRDTAHQRQREVQALIDEALAAGQKPSARLLKRQSTVDQRAKQWNNLYDSTPDGQHELEIVLATCDDDTERTHLQERLDRARDLRERELENARDYQRRRREEQQHRGEDGSLESDPVGRGSADLPPRAGADPNDFARGGSADSGDVAGREHPDGDRRRLVLAGRTVSARLTPRPPRADELGARGNVSPQLYELDTADADVFRESLRHLASTNRFAASVSVYPVEEYRTMRLFVVDDGTAGFALHGDEIVSVFIYPTSPSRGGVGTLLAAAVDQGGRRLDCYDTVLPQLYAEEGFIPVARIGWDDQYAPDG
jgi:hypothetical protein